MGADDKRYAAAVTLGCRLNQADTALIFDRLREAGYELVEPGSPLPLDLVVVNTCSVTASASQKSRQAVRALRKRHPGAKVVVTGCGVEVEPEFWKAEPAADLLVPNAAKTALANYLGAPPPPRVPDGPFVEPATGHYPFKRRANLKIQEGCDNCCAYCVVPLGRGKPRSRDKADAVREFRLLLERGHREIVLAGVNIATYSDSGAFLPDLVAELLALPGDFRVRLSSTEPHPGNGRLLELMRDNPGRLCAFLHLPLQHGADELLRSMGRKYSREEYAAFARRAVELVPDICLGSDVIVGLPGETPELFAASMAFVGSLPLAYLHVFGYSRRAGTRAASFPGQVAAKDIAARHKELSGVGRGLSRRFVAAQLGSVVEVLLEEASGPDLASGWSGNYIKVAAGGPGAGRRLGELVKVELAAPAGPRGAEGRIWDVNSAQPAKPFPQGGI